MNNRYFLFTVLFLLLTQNAFAQIYHPNPYKFLPFWDYYMEFNKAEISQNKVQKIIIQKIRHEKTKSGKANDIVLMNQTIDFDSAYNPINYHSDYLFEVWWWPAFKIKMGWEIQEYNIYDYTFEYDNQSRLTHSKEIYHETFSGKTFYENDYHFSYDSLGRVINETFSDKYIYSSSSRYTNDTTIVDIEISYSSDLIVDTIYRRSTDYNYLTYNKRKDTLIFNCPFDSVFNTRLRQNLHGDRFDYKGRLIQSVFYSKRIPHYHYDEYRGVESDTDIITKYYYNRKDKLSKITSSQRNGKRSNKQIFYYHLNGLIKSTTHKEGNTVTYYTYQ